MFSNIQFLALFVGFFTVLIFVGLAVTGLFVGFDVVGFDVGGCSCVIAGITPGEQLYTSGASVIN